MVFPVRKLFLCRHEVNKPTWMGYFGSQRYEISEMIGFFRSDDSREQAEESELICLAGSYSKVIDSVLPVITVPSSLALSVGRVEIIGIAQKEDNEQQVYNSVRRYAEALARKRRLEFCDLTSKGLETKAL